jgi:hypothetical protein
MKHRLAALLLAPIVIAIAIILGSSARAAIGLTTPVVTTVNAVACISFQCNWGSGTDLGAAQCTILYGPVDTNGNFISGAQQQTSGILPTAALNAFVSTSGNARVRCQAALISAVPALAGDAQ